MKIPGEALRMLSVTSKEKETFKLHEENLSKILLDNDVKDRSVMVVAIVGPSRKGKSFLMNFFLRYMTARYVNDDSDWLADDQSPLEGFLWSGGSGKVTVGLEMWSKPFIVKCSPTSEVAVLFLDSQGTFDHQSSLLEDTAIFALTTLCSSLLIYNLSSDILSVDLMHLELFISYGMEAFNYERQTGSSNLKPFQKLVFLIRDYVFKNEYGEEEGKRHMKKRFTTENKETKYIITNILNCFSDVTCFVLPSIGLKKLRHKSFDGKIRDINGKFIEHLKVLASSLLCPERLVIKEIMGEGVTGYQLYLCFKSYVKIFNSGVLPEPKTIFEATIEVNNLIATDKAKDTYTQLMDKEFGGEMPYSMPSRLERRHLEIKSTALEQFRSVVKMGGDRYSRPFERKLDIDLDRMAVTYRKNNSAKNTARKFRTPVIFLVISLACYILSRLFTIFDHKPLVQSSILVGVLSMIVFLSMTYVRISQVIQRLS